MEQHIRVLIADDRRRSRNGLRALLASWPAVEVVCEAMDGRQAVHLVEEHQPDVVLMDVWMPVLDGLEATRLIKSRWPEVKVVVLTIDVLYRADALAAGADGFLVKGCPTEALFQAISEEALTASPCHQERPPSVERGTGRPALRTAPAWGFL